VQAGISSYIEYKKRKRTHESDSSHAFGHGFKLGTTSGVAFFGYPVNQGAR
jgi:hypothetical protein